MFFKLESKAEIELGYKNKLAGGGSIFSCNSANKSNMEVPLHPTTQNCSYVGIRVLDVI